MSMAIEQFCCSYSSLVVRTKLKFQTAMRARAYCRPYSTQSPHAHPDQVELEKIKQGQSSDTVTGSTKLFADAVNEDAQLEEMSTTQLRVRQRLAQANFEQENWTGEEDVHDTVLRMLVDKYKPLRGEAIQNADDKLRQQPPRVATLEPSSPSDPKSSNDALFQASSTAPSYSPDWRARASEPLLPAIEGHRPWHTTYVAPAPTTARVRIGAFSKPLPGKAFDSDNAKGDLSSRRSGTDARRLGQARESTLDYRLGIRKTERSSQSDDEVRPAMIATGGRGWTSLVEEKIERARLQGQFKFLKGRGKPLVQTVEERNPFIAREEFLMNRIVQRNEAAPPWVELQKELNLAVASFRSTLLSSWTRRAVRLLTTTSSPGVITRLRSLSLEDARSLRDSEWEKREHAYHSAAVDDLNETVRRYNGVAPYIVRKSYFVREKELEKVYWDGGEVILECLQERLKKPIDIELRGVSDEGNLSRSNLMSFGTVTSVGSFWKGMVSFIRDLRGQQQSV